MIETWTVPERWTLPYQPRHVPRRSGFARCVEWWGRAQPQPPLRAPDYVAVGAPAQIRRAQTWRATWRPSC